MRNKLSSCCLALLLSGTSVFAQFEGVLAMNLALVSKDGNERGGGTIRLAISKTGMRGEINLRLGRAVVKNVVLCKTDTPDINYIITDANRTYTEVEVSEPTDAGSPGPEAKWTVKKLGREKLLGYKTQHVLARPKTGSSQTMELWVAKDLLDFETYQRLQGGPGGGPGDDGGLTQALKDAGAEGMPLKAVVTTAERGNVRMEVVKIEKKSLPASTFEIPPGYTKAPAGSTLTRR